MERYTRKWRCPRQAKETAMKGIFAYFLGIPVVIIVILYLMGVF